jgi:uncharacterized protein YbjT (DUF2867 family)
MRMAFLGTGIMGGPIARNLAGAGHEVTVWNRSREKAEGLGARVAESPAEAVDGAEVLVTMLADGPAIEAVVPELDPETLWIPDVDHRRRGHGALLRAAPTLRGRSGARLEAAGRDRGAPRPRRRR